MARLKIGTAIKNYGDITELIINLINASNGFSEDFIVKLTNNYIQGSLVEISEKDIHRMVDNVIDLMQKCGYVVYSNGKYTTKSTNFTLAEYYKYSQSGSIML